MKSNPYANLGLLSFFVPVLLLIHYFIENIVDKNKKSYMPRIVFFLVLSLVASYGVSKAQAVETLLPPPGYVEKIKETVYRKHLFTLAADSMEGRATGEAGQKKAAAYIESELKAAGLEVFRNEFERLLAYRVKQLKLTIGSNSFRAPEEVIPYLLPPHGKRQRWLETHVTGMDNVNSSTNTADVFLWQQRNFETKEAIETALNALIWQMPRGKTVIVVLDFGQAVTQELIGGNLRESFGYNRLEPPDKTLLLVPATFATALSTEQNNKLFLEEEIEISRRQLTENIVGIVRGQEAVAPAGEFVVLSAHYDHVGTRGKVVYNGADDNASGTAALLSIARVWAQAAREGHRPKRSIVFLFLTAEEIGLYGSEFFTTYPPIPLKQIVAGINVDMIGRVDERHQGNPNYIYLIGGKLMSDDLQATVELVNRQCCHIDLDEFYNSLNHPEQLFYRSDHYNFARRGIPVVFFFSGLHKDYHRPTDDPEKINIPRAVLLSRFIFQVAWALASQDKRPLVKPSFKQLLRE